MDIIKKIDLWRKMGRDYTLSQGVLSYILGISIAVKSTQIDWKLSILGLLGVILVQMAMNMADDYFDWKNGIAESSNTLAKQSKRTRSHKCFYLKNGTVSLNQLLLIIFSHIFVACVFGLIIAINRGFSIILIALAAGIIGLCYSAPIIKLGQRGFGELSIGIIFGPLIMMGACISAGAKVDYTLLYTSLITGTMIASLSFGASILDFDSDIKTNKKTLPIICGSKQNATAFLGLIFFASYLLIIYGIIKGIYSIYSIAIFLTLPRAIGILKIINSDTREKKFWMGYIENWTLRKQEGSDWFMLRFCTLRNTINDFIILLIISLYL